MAIAILITILLLTIWQVWRATRQSIPSANPGRRSHTGIADPSLSAGIPGAFLATDLAAGTDANAGAALGSSDQHNHHGHHGHGHGGHHHSHGDTSGHGGHGGGHGGADFGGHHGGGDFGGHSFGGGDAGGYSGGDGGGGHH